jgi:WD40 repeat protein
MYAGEVIGRFFLRVFDPTVGARRLEVWDFASGRLHWTVGDVPFRARFDISPDARRLAVGRLDQAIHIHDLESGSPIQRISLDRSASYVTFDPSGQRLALYHGNFERAEILDLRTEGRQPVFESDVISWSVAWRPDGAVIAGAAGQRVELWDVDARRTLGFLEGHEAQVVHIRFSSDGKMLLTDGWDGYAILWDAHTGHPLLRFNLTNPVLSADGRLVAGTVIDGLASRGTLFELDHALERRRLVGSGGPEVLGLARGAFDRSSGLLITAGLSNDYVRQNSGLRVFDVDRGGEIASLSGQLARCVSIATDGAFLLVGNENGVERWPVRRKEDQFIVGPPQSVLSASGVSNLDMSADGRTAIVAIDGQDEYRILDLQQPGESRRLTSESSGGSEYVRISPDGRWAAIAARGGLKAAVWDLTASTRVAELNGDSHLGMAFHPSASVLATGGADGLWLWETETWRLLRRARGTSALLDYSPDGRILASVGGAGEPFTVQLLDSRTLEEIARLTPPETYATTDLAFSPDGTLLAQITNRAGVVHLWDLRRIRSHLAEMDLDWQGPPYPQHEVRGAPISVTFDSNAGPQ